MPIRGHRRWTGATPPPFWDASIGIPEDRHVHAHATLRGVAPVTKSIPAGRQLDRQQYLTWADVRGSNASALPTDRAVVPWRASTRWWIERLELGRHVEAPGRRTRALG